MLPILAIAACATVVATGRTLPSDRDGSSIPRRYPMWSDGRIPGSTAQYWTLPQPLEIHISVASVGQPVWQGVRVDSATSGETSFTGPALPIGISLSINASRREKLDVLM